LTVTHILAAEGTSYAVIGHMLVVFVPGCAALAAIAGCYFRLQWYRADALAMAAYRKLVEDAVASQAEARERLAGRLTGPLSAEERLMMGSDEHVAAVPGPRVEAPFLRRDGQ
jgi:hypothetical protein